jgi:hypothetical protein
MKTHVRMIRQMNDIARAHGEWSDDGSLRFSGEARDYLALAADYARWALETHDPLDKRVCNAVRAKEEITRYAVLCSHAGVTASNIEHINAVQNACSLALSLACDDIRTMI